MLQGDVLILLSGLMQAMSNAVPVVSLSYVYCVVDVVLNTTVPAAEAASMEATPVPAVSWVCTWMGRSGNSC